MLCCRQDVFAAATPLAHSCPTEWDAANPAATENRPDCELNIVTEPRQFFGFPYCATGPAGGDPNDRPYLRRPGATSIADPELNAGQAAMNCSGGRKLGTMHAPAFQHACVQFALAMQTGWQASGCLPGHPLGLTGGLPPAAGANLLFTPAIQALGPHTAPLGMVGGGAPCNFHELKKKLQVNRALQRIMNHQIHQGCGVGESGEPAQLKGSASAGASTLAPSLARRPSAAAVTIFCAAVLPVGPWRQLPQAVQPRHLHCRGVQHCCGRTAPSTLCTPLNLVPVGLGGTFPVVLLNTQTCC